MVNRLLKLVVGLSVLIMVFVSYSCFVRANSPPLYMAGGTAFPINSESIVLEKESIKIHYGGEKHGVEVVFHFYNTGAETDLQIGFPNLANYNESIYDFKAFSYPDMKEYSVEKKPGGQMPGLDQYMYNSMYAWTMHFGEGERKALLVTYSYYNTRMSEEDGGYADYILETGTLWKGKISNIDVYVDFPEKAACQEILASPDNYTYNGQGIEWHFKDAEPDFNLMIAYHKLPEKLRYDWMFKPVQIKPSTPDYQWDDQIFVVDLFERWILDEAPLHTASYTENDPAAEMERILENCLLIKNEIYARHGATFKDDEWNAFFSQFPWYHPREDFSEKEFNEVENLNLQLIDIYQSHINPRADAEAFVCGIDSLFERFGDPFFRYYPVYNREVTRSSIQKLIDQRVVWWDKNQPVNIGRASDLNQRKESLKEALGLSSDAIKPWPYSKSGYWLYDPDTGRIIFKKGDKLYEAYQLIESGSEAYEQFQEIPENRAILADFYLHEWEGYIAFRKWCSEIRHPSSGELINPLDALLILPDSGEKYVLTGLYGYDRIQACSENGHMIAYLAKSNKETILYCFDTQNKLLQQFSLQADIKVKKIVVSNDGKIFVEGNGEIYYYPDGTGKAASQFVGQIIRYDNDDHVLTYAHKNEIRSFNDSDKEDMLLVSIPEVIWKVEKQDQNNNILYCHPEFYYIYNELTQKTYAYNHYAGELILCKFSPSGRYAMIRKEYDGPITIVTGGTNEQKELTLPVVGQIEWYSDNEIVVFQMTDPNDPDSREEYFYDIQSGKRVNKEETTTPSPENSVSPATDTLKPDIGENTVEAVKPVSQEGKGPEKLTITIVSVIIIGLFGAWLYILLKRKRHTP